MLEQPRYKVSSQASVEQHGFWPTPMSVPFAPSSSLAGAWPKCQESGLPSMLLSFPCSDGLLLYPFQKSLPLLRLLLAGLMGTGLMSVPWCYTRAQ